MSQEACVKQGNASGTAAEHATDGALSASGAKAPHLDKMYLEASVNAPPKMQSLLQELHAMGRYPKRYKPPANKMEKDSNSLAEKLTKARGSFTPAVQKYVDAMRSTSTATEHARHAEALMQQVRALGRIPKESHDPQECRLARELRDARATGLMIAHEPELAIIEAADERRRVIAAATEHGCASLSGGVAVDAG